MTAPTAVTSREHVPHVCCHTPTCPPADATDHDAAVVLASFPEQGWTLLCNGVVVFYDTGELLADGRSVAPHRPNPPHRPKIG